MTTIIAGYARCSTQDQDLTVQRQQLAHLGVDPQHIYTDHGRTGRTRDHRPGLREALAAVRQGDTFVVTKLDRLARSVPDAHNIVAELSGKGVRLNIGGSVHDPNDPIGRMLLTVLAMVAEFESDLLRQRTREGMAVARAKGRLKGKKPKLSRTQEKHLVQLYEARDHTVTELAAEFGVGRATVYRAVNRVREAAAPDAQGPGR